MKNLHEEPLLPPPPVFVEPAAVPVLVPFPPPPVLVPFPPPTPIIVVLPVVVSVEPPVVSVEVNGLVVIGDPEAEAEAAAPVA